MDAISRRRLFEGYGDTMSLATSWAVVPAMFAGVGWWLGGILGSRPLLTAGFVIWAVIGLFIKTWVAFGADLDAEIPAVVKAGPLATQVPFDLPRVASPGTATEPDQHGTVG